MYRLNPLYCIAVHHKRVSTDNVWAQDLALAIVRVKTEFTACGVVNPGHPRGISPLRGRGGGCESWVIYA